MVRECRPREREPVRSWLARRSTMATSTPASASSPANISPVGPPPATTTSWSAIRHPHFLRFWFQPETLMHDPGLAASPPVRCMLRVARSECSPSLDGPLWANYLLAKRRRAAYGGTVGPEGSPVGLRMQTRNEKFFTLFSRAGSNVVESAAIVREGQRVSA